MTNVNEIRYVFDLKREYVVPKHIINYLKMYGVFVDCGRHLYSPKKEGFDYYRAAFSYYGKDIKQVRDDQSCAWILDLPNHDQIMIFDNGDISFNAGKIGSDESVDYKKKFDIAWRLDGEAAYLIFRYNGNETHVKISTDKFGDNISCIYITLCDFYANMYLNKPAKRCQILPGQPFSPDEYIEMLKGEINSEGIYNNKEELKWLLAVFDDPRLRELLSQLLMELPYSVEEWYNRKLEYLAAQKAAREALVRNPWDLARLEVFYNKTIRMLKWDKCSLEKDIINSRPVSELPELIKFYERKWR